MTTTESHLAYETDGGVVAGSVRTGPVFNPGTGAQIGDLPFADAEAVGASVATAKAAAQDWGKSSLSARAEIMFQIRAALREHREELAGLIVIENGKTAVDAIGEVGRGLESVEFACGIPQLLQGVHSSNVATDVDVHSVRYPIGVVGAITPFNFPVMVPLWMLSTALACGNAAILKPSEKAPSAPTRLAELMTEAGLPEGVLQVVHGDRETVDALIQHPDVGAISFVGSTPVARQIYDRAASAGKRVQALGGAKNHMVVMPDADLEAAADAAVAAGYGAAGERCMAVSVIIAVGGVADQLIGAITERAGRLRVGPGSEEGVQMGPLISREHRDRVGSYLDSAARDGAEVVLDGRRAPSAGQPGFFLGPSLIDGVRPGISAYDDEIFGPVLGVVRVDSFEEAVTLVRDNPFGNGAALFTRDGGTARLFERECNIGMVGVNVPIPVPVAWSSFGGWKSSLFGDSHMYGPEGIRFFTRQQVVTTRWPDS
jgi:malonate-semialdehyde dehydrogenase (acetylating) / methylmalonate-semialdehyde dehydrogenase